MSGVRLELAGAVATLVLARPEARNALTAEMGEAFEKHVRALEARDDVRVVVLRGEGKCFSAGGDLAFIEARRAASPDENERAMRRFYEYFLSVRALKVPTVAVLHGANMGAGVCLALACDMRVAAEDAKVGLNFVRLGLHPGMGATYTLPALVGPARAAELLLTGRTIAADEALRIGLVNAVHPATELDAAVARLVAELAAAAPLAAAHTKRTLVSLEGRPLDELLAAEARAQSLEYGSDDLAEGVRAIRERRAPVFKGR